MGEVELSIEPFDWDADLLSDRPVNPAELPGFSISLHRCGAGANQPGEELAPEQLRIKPLAGDSPVARLFRVEAPGMRAFLRVDHRGREGERCPPSWIYLDSLPGYAERRRGERPLWRIRVPTCRASLADTVVIPAGEVIFGGQGEPPVKEPEFAEPERTVNLPAFRIDRTEVSNAAFASFAELAQISGEEPPNYPAPELLPGAAEADHPVTGITARTAQAYCAYFGKRLPTFVEWVKTVRGGLQLPDGAANPAPRRLYPWAGRQAPPGINFDGAGDGCAASCSVKARAPETGIYGVRDLVGNVGEWGSGREKPGDLELALFFGGGFRTAPDDTLSTSVAGNLREYRYFDFQTGFRCVAPIETPEEVNYGSDRTAG
jgi:formylglycine-generating enzyme required for sulfatase activity